MTPERFQEAKRIYNSALERDPAQRKAYLLGACGGDESLRQEVESLLGRLSEAQEFFNQPVFHTSVSAAREPPMDFTGRAISHYAILEKLGEGGMGVVYKAQDTHLDRRIALKVLPPGKITDPERTRRFVQEAKAASALNHPNIVTIHDIDTHEGVTFIAMEFVKGKTLDQLIRGEGMPLSQILEHAVQIADALAVAHVAGIIHRDIKPANIMVTDAGIVKVLDFGLAKLIEDTLSLDAEPSSASGPNTQAGVILGTAGYMSPEQAAGQDVDARSDIFAFGSVLYEMTTRRRAFSGDTNARTLAAILHEDPTSISQLAPETPRELQEVVCRCLQKKPERRFQHMSELKAALQHVKHQSDSPVLPRATRRGRRLLALGVFVVAAELGIGVWFGVLRPPVRSPAKVTTLTALPGQQTEPALSPDGTQVAFVWNGQGRGNQDNYDIYVQSVGSATPRRLTRDPAFDYSPVWSPDGQQIVFLRTRPSGTEVISIPAAGGPEKKLLVSSASSSWQAFAKLFCGPAWSPNRNFLAVVDKESPEAPNSIFLFNMETGGKRKLTVPPPAFADGLSAFSRDGRLLAFVRRGSASPLSDIYVLPLSDHGEAEGAPHRITHDHTFIYGLDWSADGRSLVFGSQRGGVPALWQVSRWGGQPERLSFGGTDALWPSVSRKGGRLAYAYGMPDVNIWRVGMPNRGRATAPARITHSPQIDMYPVFSPDGSKIAWASMHSGAHQIWVCNSDGSKPNQLTYFDPPGAATPQWSPAGRHIAFRGFLKSGVTHVYVTGAGGGTPQRLTTGDFGEDRFSWSRDGKWIYFVSNRAGGNALWKAPAEGGSPILLAALPVSAPPRGPLCCAGLGPGPAVEASDGRFVYYSGAEGSIWKVPTGGGSPALVAREGRGPVESADGKFVYYTGLDESIWRVPAEGGETVAVVKLGQRALWTLSAAGIHVLEPNSRDGPVLEWFSFAGRRSAVVRLPGGPDTYLEPIGGIVASTDGGWTLYLHEDGIKPKIMLVENFQ